MPTPEELLARFNEARDAHSATARRVGEQRREIRHRVREAARVYREADYHGRTERLSSLSAELDAAINEEFRLRDLATEEMRVTSRKKKVALEAVLADRTATGLLADQSIREGREAREWLANYKAEEAAKALRQES